MGKHIVVTVDGSPLSVRALPVVAALAQAGDRVELVTAVEPVPPFHVPHYAEAAESWVTKRQEAALEYLDSGTYDVDRTVLFRSPSVALVEHVQEHEPDLVVMATHGRGPVTRSWIGSTADRLIRSASAPILTIRPEGDAAPTKEPGPSVNKVLVPLDGSPLAEAAIQGAFDAFGESTELVFLGVIETGHIPGSVYVPDQILDRRRIEEGVAAYLDGMVASLSATGRSVSSLVRVGERASEEIVLAAESEECDAIAMATHGRGGLARIALGSVTDKVLRTAPGLVLSVPRPPGLEE